LNPNVQAATDIIDAHSLNTIKLAYEYLIDDRSNGDDHTAAAAPVILRQMFKVSHPSRLFFEPSRGMLLLYVANVLLEAAKSHVKTQ
jgi:hypothetical protein